MRALVVDGGADVFQRVTSLVTTLCIMTPGLRVLLPISDRIYCDAEWQGDAFAGCLMIPRNLIHQYPKAEIAAAAFGRRSRRASDDFQV